MKQYKNFITQFVDFTQLKVRKYPLVSKFGEVAVCRPFSASRKKQAADLNLILPKYCFT